MADQPFVPQIVESTPNPTPSYPYFGPCYFWALGGAFSTPDAPGVVPTTVSKALRWQPPRPRPRPR